MFAPRSATRRFGAPRISKILAWHEMRRISGVKADMGMEQSAMLSENCGQEEISCEHFRCLLAIFRIATKNTFCF